MIENFVLLRVVKLKRLTLFNSIVNNGFKEVVIFLKFLFLQQNFKFVNKIIRVLFDTFDSPIDNAIIDIFGVESLVLIIDPHKYDF
jgi:hypothetical protein